ncbi:LOW QUALITY PROTEIN: UDP-glycosyltransferase 84B1-like [Prosopis cineraria]|uniref:LOW QUALITY PROTEIN: UDP-glycosyltransferase 84B1-like n=1 Tax=Prosopis cineraria TaxID=364024 RepID=UPI00241068A9|nr:LOW QUALITY PROTEIN: UDP-glycosyltransferase 84B1-like [Prosopis cineraria]
MAASKEDHQELHVLMVAFSAQSHINPLLRLGHSLLSKGLHVTLATTEVVYHPYFASSAAVPDSITINGIQVLFFSDGFNQEDRKNTNLDQYMEKIQIVGPTSLSNLIKNHFVAGPKKLACVINNPFVPWVADVAEEAGIPCACVWIQPCAVYVIYYRFYNELNQFPTATEPEKVVELPGFPLLRHQDLPSFVLPTNPFGSMPKVLSEMFRNVKKFKWVLANSFYELEKDAKDSMADLCPILPVGPLVPPSLLSEDEHDQKQDVGIEMWKPDDSCMKWLNNRAPGSVIYISFGSIMVPSAKQIESITVALKRTKRHFLWVMKTLEKSIVADGGGGIPLDFLEETREQGLVVSWCPQTKVLVHPATACFLTHCGWNSVLEAITAGTPLIAYPQWSDQPTNAKLISDVFRTGIRLEQDGDGFVGSQEVERAIEEIVGGSRSEEIRKNAEMLKLAAREAVADGGSSDRNIQLFVDQLIGKR